jgi:hypothetical protein
MNGRGQVIVELALALPLLLFVILGGVEAGFLVVAKADQDRRTAVVAEWAADHPGDSWQSVANKELRGCSVEVVETERDVIEATTRCRYSPKVLVMFSGIPISSRQIAARRREPSHPEATPAASPS